MMKRSLDLIICHYLYLMLSCLSSLMLVIYLFIYLSIYLLCLRDSLQIEDISAAIKLLSLQAMPGTESVRNTPKNSPRNSPLTAVREVYEDLTLEIGKLDSLPVSTHVLQQGKTDTNYQALQKLARSDSGLSIKSTRSTASTKTKRAAHTRTMSQDSGFEEGTSEYILYY